ncbi:palmitoyltransferase ZDHHC14-like isoform X2 [Convolutriloba macropyga]|uniref:palmitoyltransferase ZDHHC14-like isoform X2 n=1 Tax=Convolutriloba macropyga TaxID=536237 RepID=UPI003F523A75
MGLFRDKDDEMKKPINKSEKERASKRVRRADLFQGRNTLCCHGRVVMAKNLLSFLITLMLILVPSVLFFIFESPYLWEHVHETVPLIQAVLFIAVMSNLFFAAFTDPGIVPRATDEEGAFYRREEERRGPQNTDDTVKPMGGKSSSGRSAHIRAMRARTIRVNNVEVSLKWCYTCMIWRPPRASHCASCDNCIVAKDEGTINRALKKSPPSIIILVICFGSFFVVLGMLVYHLYLVSFYLTTWEEIKGFWSPSKKGKHKSPFRPGNCCKNMCAALCGPRHPRLLKLEKYIDEDEEEERKVRSLFIYGSTGQAPSDNQSQEVNPRESISIVDSGASRKSSRSESIVSSTSGRRRSSGTRNNKRELFSIDESRMEDENAPDAPTRKLSYDYVVRSDDLYKPFSNQPVVGETAGRTDDAVIDVEEEENPEEESGVTAKSEPHIVSAPKRSSQSTEKNIAPRQSLDQRYSLTSSAKSAVGASGGIATGTTTKTGPRKRSDVPSIQLSAQNSLDPTTLESTDDRINSPNKLYPDYEPDNYWDEAENAAEDEEFEDYSSSDSSAGQVELQIQRTYDSNESVKNNK